MGLDTTHDAWEGPYSYFGEWRAFVAEKSGFPPLREMEGFRNGTIPFSFLDTEMGRLTYPAADLRLVPLLDHSDCDGEITPEDCARIADALHDLLGRLPPASPHVDASYYFDKTRQFMDGCRAAAAASEPLEFF